MGGHVFGVVARRLTSSQHSALYNYASGRLQPFTRFCVDSPPTAHDIVSHGDLDILMGNWVEGEGFKTNFAVDKSNLDRSNLQDFSRWQEVGATEGYHWTVQDVTEWAKTVAITLGARSWQNHQHGVSLAVPCCVIADFVPDCGPDEIDIRMIRPDRFDFARFIMSYGVTALLLAQAMRCLSPVLVIHHEHLVIRHCAYPGLAPIEVELTSDYPSLLQWVGLCYRDWHDGFLTQKNFWEWIAGVEPKSDCCCGPQEKRLICRAWIIFTVSGAEVPRVKTRHQPARLLEMDRSRDWLRSEYSKPEYSHMWHDSPPEPTASPDLPTSKTFTIVTKTTVNVDHLTGRTTKLSTDTNIENQPSRSIESSKPTLDPKCPVSLDDFAQEALAHFGKKEAYDREVAKQFAEATRLYERQRRRAQNREFSERHEDPVARAEKALLAQGK